MVPFAVTLSDLIVKGGAYVGIAAFFGLAILTVLYFAQARELKRLREWAGRAPERAQELEERVMAQADQARQVRKPVPQGAVQAQPQKPPAKPATAAGGTPKPAPATAAAAAGAAAAATAAGAGAAAATKPADGNGKPPAEGEQAPEAEPT